MHMYMYIYIYIYIYRYVCIHIHTMSRAELGIHDRMDAYSSKPFEKNRRAESGYSDVA